MVKENSMDFTWINMDNIKKWFGNKKVRERFNIQKVDVQGFMVVLTTKYNNN